MRRPSVHEANAAARIVAAIEKDLSSRLGFGYMWEGVEPENKDAIRAEWHRLALKEILHLTA
jgi:hypothetical protein